MIEPIRNVSFTGRKRILSKEDIRIIPASNPTDLEKSMENILGIEPTSTVKRRTEGIRVPGPLAWGGSSTTRVLLRLCPESACQPGPSLELSCRLEAGGCAVRASPVRLGSLAQPQRRGTSP